MLNLKQSFRNNADNWGVALSFLCALHCIALPFMALVFPLFAHYLDNNYIHIILFIVLIPISFIAFVKQKKHHQKLTPTVLASIGLTCLLIGIILGQQSAHHHHHHHQLSGEEAFSAIGSVMLVIAHLLNLKHLRNCRKCNHH